MRKHFPGNQRWFARAAGVACGAWITAAAAAPPAPVFHLDFDPPDMVRIGTDRWCPLTFDPQLLAPGRAGNGIRVPLEAANLLPAEQALPTATALEQWRCEGAQVQADTLISGRSTAANSARITFPDRGTGVFLPAVKQSAKASAPERSVSFVFSCYLRAATEPCTLKLTVQGKARTNDKRETAAEAAKDVVVAADSWQRAAVVLEFPADTVAQEFVCGLESTTAGSAVARVEALQVERCRNHPQFQDLPATWMPGGSSRPRMVPPGFPLDTVPMPIEAGTISLRVRLDPVPAGHSAGDLTWLAIGAGWDVGWEFSDRQFALGRDVVRFPTLVSRMQDDTFHQLALTWTADEAVAWLDGVPLNRVKRATPFPGPEQRQFYQVVVGMSTSRARTGHGIIDDLAVFDRPLTQEELQSLVLPERSSGQRLSAPSREQFTRDEDEAEMTLRLRGVVPGANWLQRQRDRLRSGNDTGVTARAMLAVAPGVELEVQPRVAWREGDVEIGVPLTPSRFSTGVKECRLRLTVDRSEKEYRLPFEVHPARPPSPYGLMLWSCRKDADSLRRYQAAGVRIADFAVGGELVRRDLQALGLRTSAHYNNYRPDPHPTAPENWENMERNARTMAARLTRQAHLTPYCLLNSEVSGRDDITTSPRAMQALKADTGLDAPPLPAGADLADLSSRPKLDLRAYRDSGIVPAALPQLRYLEWLLAKGDGIAMANGEIARILRAANPGLRVLGEPAHPTIYQYGHIDGRDVAGTWCYEQELGAMQWRFSGGQAYARHGGIGFYPILGYIYCIGPQDLGNGQKGEPSISADAARARLWLTLAQPAEFFCIWNYEAYGAKGWAEGELYPGLYEAHTATMRDLNRLGPVFGPLPWRRPTLALLASFTTQLGRGAEHWWHWYGQAVSTMGGTLNNHNAFYDLLYESDVRNDRLTAYDTLVLPAALYLPADVHARIADWSRRGGKVILDNQANPAFSFASQERLECFGPNRGLAPTVLTDVVGAWARTYREASTTYYATAETTETLVYTKESGSARYVIAINNRWTERPNLELRDVGLPVDTVLRLREANPAAAVYDMVAGQRVHVPPSAEGVLRLPCALGPGAGRLFAVYPQAIATVAVAPGKTLARGTAGTVAVRILDAAGRPVSGRQGLEIEVQTPDGGRWDSSGIYAADNGFATIHLRPPLDAPAGKWRITSREMASGKQAEAEVRVE